MKKTISLILAFFLISLYLTLNIILLIHHEPYEDEAQAWLIARDLDIVSIFKQMAYEGTPALWHMLLVPLAKSGAPYISEFILHIIIAVAAVTIFVLYAPFSKITKVLFSFSYYMAYEYSIIARSYCLSILLLFLIAALYGKRFEHPLWYAFLIFLLFNTNVHSFFIASSLTILFAWEFYRDSVEKSRAKIAVLVMCLGGLFCFLQLLSPPDSINYGIVSEINPLVPFIAIANAFLPWSLFTPGSIGTILTVISFLIFCTIILSVIRKPAVLFIAMLSLAGLFYIFVFKYPGAMRHHGIILIILFFILWINRYYEESTRKDSDRTSNIDLSKISVIVINACLLVSLPYSLKIQYTEYKYVFSGAKKMANFIKHNHLDSHIIVAHRPTGVSAILPYLPGKPFWYAGIKAYGTYIKYDKEYLAGRDISNSQVISRTQGAFPDNSPLLLLLTKPLDFPESYGFRLQYKTDENAFGYNREQFYLYKRI